MKILNRYTQFTLWESDHATLRETAVAAAKSDADLGGADLGDANLRDAIIAGCALGVSTWASYLADVVPALLTAGEVALRAILDAGAWECNSWDNCPIHVAFNAPNIDGVPPLHRPRAQQFVILFDAGLIPRSVVEDAIARQEAP